MFGQAEAEGNPASYDLPDIQASGELIAVTLSGPDTYYEYRGKGFGLQFELAEAFAHTIGARLRMEMATDTADLLQRLILGEADLVAFETDTLTTADEQLTPCANRWLVRSSSTQLAEAVDKWWRPELTAELQALQQQRATSTQSVRRTARPVMLSRSDGVISKYDDMFIRHASAVGWDWRLLAAQCYQESAFDPNAISWAGARGLMQIMPGTASHLGLPLTAIYEPEQNIAAAARYLRELSAKFSDVSDRLERISFVLAAYNGGSGHVRDAMALASKHGRNPHRWADVDPFILGLAQPQYYRDPVVQNGYLRGSETSAYVRQIHARWAAYRGSARAASSYAQPIRSRKGKNKVSRVRGREEFMIDSL